MVRALLVARANVHMATPRGLTAVIGAAVARNLPGDEATQLGRERAAELLASRREVTNQDLRMPDAEGCSALAALPRLEEWVREARARPPRQRCEYGMECDDRSFEHATDFCHLGDLEWHTNFCHPGGKGLGKGAKGLGAKGAKGAKGAEGAKGAKGAKGLAAKGVKGAQGLAAKGARRGGAAPQAVRVRLPIGEVMPVLLHTY